MEMSALQITQTGRLVVLVLWAAVLAGCAHSTPTPVAREAAPTADLATYRHLLITSEAASGVFIPDHEQQGVITIVKRELAQRAPGRFTFVAPATAGFPAAGPAAASPEPPKTLHVNILFTEYDEGSAVARFMLAGLGQIRIGSDVKLWDEHTRRPLGSYEVSKQFAFGGIYGAVTDMEDVQQGLAKGIAEVLIPTSGRRTGGATAARL